MGALRSWEHLSLSPCPGDSSSSHRPLCPPSASRQDLPPSTSPKQEAIVFLAFFSLLALLSRLKIDFLCFVCVLGPESVGDSSHPFQRKGTTVSRKSCPDDHTFPFSTSLPPKGPPRAALGCSLPVLLSRSLPQPLVILAALLVCSPTPDVFRLLGLMSLSPAECGAAEAPTAPS